MARFKYPTSKAIYQSKPKGYRNVKKGMILMEILLRYGIADEEEVKTALYNPGGWRFTIPRMLALHYIKTRENNGSRLLILKRQGLNHLKHLRKTHPELFTDEMYGWDRRLKDKGINPNLETFYPPE